MNPCPCGNYGVKGKECTCSAQQIEKYKRKLSGPIVDRIDLWLEVSKIEHEKLTDKHQFSETEKMREQVALAREAQARRYGEKDLKIKTNAELSAKDLVSHIALSEDVKNLLNTSAKQLDLSARIYHRLIKIAQTIADIDGAPAISEAHILEALQYRPKKYQVI
jgi:magnesium chelatase family protein